MATKTPPSDQRSGLRPISFLLQDGGTIGVPVTLAIRPEELTRSESSRTSVSQTLGRDVQGWADQFGQGLPSVTIAGHTGWRLSTGTGQDGMQHFEALNRLVQHDYHNAIQAAVNNGRDPSTVRLIFIDMLDNFVWSVVPMTFVLKRSRSRPLLYQYNIQLQAIDTSIDNPTRLLPDQGSVSSGLTALQAAVSRFRTITANIRSVVDRAVSMVDSVLAPIARTVEDFVNLTADLMDEVNLTVAAVKNGISSTANRLIGIASDVAKVGQNVFRTLSNIASIPDHAKAALSKVASAYNEMLCIMRNSLRISALYGDYGSMFGASNCSSTTGGRPASPHAGSPVFEKMHDVNPPRMSRPAVDSATSLRNIDPVLAPMPLAQMGQELGAVVDGYNPGVAA